LDLHSPGLAVLFRFAGDEAERDAESFDRGGLDLDPLQAHAAKFVEPALVRPLSGSLVQPHPRTERIDPCLQRLPAASNRYSATNSLPPGSTGW